MCPTSQGLGLSPQGFGLPSPSCDDPRAPGCTCRGLGGGSPWHEHRRMFPRTMRAKLPCEGAGRESDPAGQWDCLCFCGRRLGKCQAGRKGRNLQVRKKFPLLWVVSWGHGLHGLNSCVRRSCLNTSSERAGCVRQSFLPQDHWTTSRAHPHGKQPVAPGSPLGCHPHSSSWLHLSALSLTEQVLLKTKAGSYKAKQRSEM